MSARQIGLHFAATVNGARAFRTADLLRGGCIWHKCASRSNLNFKQTMLFLSSEPLAIRSRTGAQPLPPTTEAQSLRPSTPPANF
jgi:hypothetical protein